MSEAGILVSRYGQASIAIVRKRIETAIVEGNDLRAVHLDGLLAMVEQMLGRNQHSARVRA
ncbi:MAG: hypothetical protein ABW184_05635 [Sphingobium sp.]